MPPLLLLLLLFTAAATTTSTTTTPTFQEAPSYQNSPTCPTIPAFNHPNPSIIHISMTLDTHYLRGSIAAVLSILQHASCPQNIVFHFLLSHHLRHLHRTILSTFPYLNFHFYFFNTNLVTNKISLSVRPALDQPLNYARIYLPSLLPSHVHRVVYLDSDLILVDDVAKLWSIDLRRHVLGAPEYCRANFTHYFTQKFWDNPKFAKHAFQDRKTRKPCYFNTGVMVIDVVKWREGRFIERLEMWMELQKRERIYELGSLPPFLLVFAGDVKGVGHRWNQHGLGGDNIEGLCRDLHPGPVSLLHWSGKGKPWLRLDSKKPCPLDGLWAPYDLYRHESPFSDV